MPSSITHSYFALDVYNCLDYTQRKLLKQYTNQLKTFAQGPDVLFFYKLLYPLCGKPIRDLGNYMQQNKTQSFFINLITEIKNRNLNKNPEILAFLYGFISHYVLDSTMHPYVIYKTGVFEPKIKDTIKYIGGHSRIELYIDAYLINVRAKMKPSHFKTHLFCLPTTSLSDELKNIIDVAFYKTFQERAMGSKYEKSIKYMKFLYRVFRNDRTGLKKILYSLGKILPLNVALDSISYHIKLDNNDYYLNLSKDSWHHPLNENIVYNYSVIELYAIALSKTRRLIKDVDDVLENKHSINDLKKLFPNLSYLTGYDCKLGEGTHFSY